MNNWVLENLVSTDELFEEALQIQETCLSVNNNSCGKLVSSFELPVMLGDILIVISVSFLVAAFNLFSCGPDNFTFNLLYWVISYI